MMHCNKAGSNGSTFHIRFGVTFSDSLIVTFSGNSASYFGGAICTEGITILFSGMSPAITVQYKIMELFITSVTLICQFLKINFIDNSATNGGAIYLDHSSVSLGSFRIVSFLIASMQFQVELYLTYQEKNQT